MADPKQYTFPALAAGHTLSAEMAEDVTVIEVTFTRKDTNVVSGTYQINGGSSQNITWNTGISVNVGDTLSFSGTAARGYKMNGYKVIGTESQEIIEEHTGVSSGSYTTDTNDIEIELDVIAETARNISFSRDSNVRVSTVKYGINAAATTSASWNNAITVYDGDTVSFIGTATSGSNITGYEIRDYNTSQVISTGTGASGSVEINGRDIQVKFISVTPRTVTFKKDSGIIDGTYSINGTPHTITFNTPISCVAGDEFTFSAVAQTGKVVVGYTIKNSTTQSAITEGSGASGSYTVSAANVDITFSSGYQITVTQPSHGTITPDTSAYAPGSTPTFTVTPDSGYHVSKIKVDGQEVQPDS